MDILSSRTILHPADLERTLAFYRDALGLAVAREFGEGAGRGVVFFAGGGFLEVVGEGPTPERPGVALWLQVRSMEDTFVASVPAARSLPARHASNRGDSSKHGSTTPTACASIW